MTAEQELALAKLIGCVEGIVESGLLSEKTELMFRCILAETLSVFGLPSRLELVDIMRVQ